MIGTEIPLEYHSLGMPPDDEPTEPDYPTHIRRLIGE